MKQDDPIDFDEAVEVDDGILSKNMNSTIFETDDMETIFDGNHTDDGLNLIHCYIFLYFSFLSLC